ncbi:glycosyltransferase [Rhabdothermincola salaria]|uniref:glycosyltransferase n=1 Tax=Rhabdothermincola salaria TaxID=2903142 RepID=UPI001E4DBE69|nr:glycosyltransferase [Rhabdothermincola salaria]MCD9622752.1 glycosyltransferase [Rhabdothermincola salaria]
MNAAAGGPGVPRILYLITDPISTRLLKGQLAYLRDHGFDVELASAPGADLHAFGASEGVVAHELPFVREPSPWKDMRALVATVRLIRRRRPQVVSASTPKAGLLGTVAAWLCRVGVRVYVVRGLRFETLTGRRRTLFKALERLAVRCSTQTLFNSRSLRALAEYEGIIAPGRGIVLGAGSGNGVDVERFANLPDKSVVRAELGLPDNAFVVGFVGRLVRDKGFVDLIEAFDIAARVREDMRLLVVGDYEPGDPVDEATRVRVAADMRILHVGWVDEPDQMYAAMDVLAFPSFREGLPNAPLEAQAAGVPVVGYTATGTVDAVSPAPCSRLVQIGDVQALATALVAAANCPVAGSSSSSWVRDRFDRRQVHSTLRDHFGLWQGAVDEKFAVGIPRYSGDTP